MSYPATFTCDYCGHRGDLDEFEQRPRGAGLRCRNAEACDARDEDRHKADLAEPTRTDERGTK